MAPDVGSIVVDKGFQETIAASCQRLAQGPKVPDHQGAHRDPSQIFVYHSSKPGQWPDLSSPKTEDFCRMTPKSLDLTVTRRDDRGRCSGSPLEQVKS